MTTVWLEAALNGPWGSDHQLNSPVSVENCTEQGIVCVEAGTTIIHLHSYDDAGTEHHDVDTWASSKAFRIMLSNRVPEHPLTRNRVSKGSRLMNGSLTKTHLAMLDCLNGQSSI